MKIFGRILIIIVILCGIGGITWYYFTKDNKSYICTIEDRKSNIYSLEDREINYVSFREYRFDYELRNVKNGVVEFTYYFDNFNDFNDLSAESFVDLEYDTFEFDVNELFQKRITHMNLGEKSFLKENKIFNVEDYIKFLEGYGVHKCRVK